LSGIIRPGLPYPATAAHHGESADHDRRLPDQCGDLRYALNDGGHRVSGECHTATRHAPIDPGGPGIKNLASATSVLGQVQCDEEGMCEWPLERAGRKVYPMTASRGNRSHPCRATRL
jgi:hypothetical protein